MHGFQNVRFALVHVKSTNHKYNAKEQLVEESLSNLLSAPPSDEQLSAITQLAGGENLSGEVSSGAEADIS